MKDKKTTADATPTELPPLRPAITRRGEIKGIDFTYNMGDEVRDIMTGIEGTIEGRQDCITGCSRMCIQPKSKDRVTLPSGYWIDQDRLELLVEAGAPAFEVVKAGGPITAATQTTSR